VDWIKVASMHLEGATTHWFQSAECWVRSTSWEEFCTLIHDGFGRDQHEALICQLFHIHQTGVVTDYVDQYSTLIHYYRTRHHSRFIIAGYTTAGCDISSQPAQKLVRL
jgi:hypothetical protein